MVSMFLTISGDKQKIAAMALSVCFLGKLCLRQNQNVSKIRERGEQ